MLAISDTKYADEVVAARTGETPPPTAIIESPTMIVAPFHCRNTIGSGGNSYAHGRGVDATKSFASSSIQKTSTVATSSTKVPTFRSLVATQVVVGSSKIVCWFQHPHHPSQHCPVMVTIGPLVCKGRSSHQTRFQHDNFPDEVT